MLLQKGFNLDLPKSGEVKNDDDLINTKITINSNYSHPNDP